MHEGDYEVRLDVDDSLWTNSNGRDEVLSLSRWCGDTRPDDDTRKKADPGKNQINCPPLAHPYFQSSQKIPVVIQSPR